jgi:hypothetical protein
MEALQRIMDTTIENVKAFAAGRTQNDVTVPKPRPKPEKKK